MIPIDQVMQQIRMLNLNDFRFIVSHLELNHPAVYKSLSEHIDKYLKRKQKPE